MDNPAQSRGTLEDVSMAGAEERRSKGRFYLKMFLGLWEVRILLSLSQHGVFHHHINGVLAQDLPPITIQLFRHGYFQPVSSAPRLLSLLMCLTTFYMDAMECKCAGLSFFFQKLRRFTNNAAPASVPVGLLTHDSGQLTYWIISEPIQRAAMCVMPVAEPPGLEKV